MENLKNKLKEYWVQRDQIPTGVWVLLLSYSLVAFGSPMPPRITWLETIMGGGLLIGGIMLAGNVIRQARDNAVLGWVLILAFALLIVPTCVGLVYGNSLSNMVRDILPLVFLLSPSILLFQSKLSSNGVVYSRLLVAVLLLVGIVSAITFFIGIDNLTGSPEAMVSTMRRGFAQFDVLQAASQAESNANALREIFTKIYDPAVLFAAIFLFAWGAVLIVKTWMSSFLGLLLLACGATIAYGFMMLGLRAYTVFFVLAIGIVCATRVREAGTYMRLIPIIAISLFLIWPQIESILQLLWAKQQSVGTNGKIKEWNAVLSAVSQSPQVALLGIGWGGLLLNPIFDDQTRFTHSALSFYLLKSGVIGLLSLLSCIWLLFSAWGRAGLRKLTTFELITLVSCAPPLIIGLLFQPVYKMLSFGIILALLLQLISLKEGAEISAKAKSAE